MAITIYDIAKEAGVSTATVSRVLTNANNVSDSKRRIVEDIIQKYNYKPNVMARRLNDKKTMTIGVLTADIRNPFYASLFIECERRANEKGYSLLLFNSLNINSLEFGHLEKLNEQHVDAVILIGGKVDELLSDMKFASKVNDVMVKTPVVITGKLDGTDCYQVNIDQQQAIDLVLNHLLENGHKRIALLGGNSSVQSTVEKRLRFKQTILRYELEYIDSFVSNESGYQMTDGYEEMNRLFEGGDLPSAVIAINDFAAVGIVKSITEHKMSIPKDVSLVSFDNTFISDMGLVGITSIDYDYPEFGKVLIDSAIRLIENKDVPRKQHILPKLLIRESCSKVLG